MKLCLVVNIQDVSLMHFPWEFWIDFVSEKDDIKLGKRNF